MTQGYGGIDRFRVAAALLVVAIHTTVLSTYAGGADFLLTHVAARIAVPFFFMATGFFIDYRSNKSVFGFVKKTAVLYGAATLLYLPISIYAGYYKGGNMLVNILKNIIFDGTFYHLWYLPAVILGVILLSALRRGLSLKTVTIISVMLYIVGMFGDSYYGIAAKIPAVDTMYDALFSVFTYTRNGLFYAPIFLIMGESASRHRFKMRTSLFGFAVSMALLLCEGWTLWHLNLQRHDSMYIALLPCTFFLFELLLHSKAREEKSLRRISMWIYILHPLCIIAVRGIGKISGLYSLLVENSLIHYIVVCAMSMAAAVIVTFIMKKKADYSMGRAWVELNMDNLRHNVSVLRELLPSTCILMPAVKANAYGHGAIPISHELNELGIRSFCVATVREGVQLRKHGIKGDILVLGYTHPNLFSMLCRYRLTQTVIDCNYAKMLNEYKRKIRVHIKIDTGMHRLGERYENIEEIMHIFECRNIKIDGIYTHLCADTTTCECDRAYTYQQMANFEKVISEIKKHGYVCPKIHVQSSYGVLNYPEFAADYARVGIALYGVLSKNDDSITNALRPVLSLKARITLTKNLFCGESAGYDLQFVAQRDMRIAVLSIGYGDGIPRSLSCGVGNVLINGIRAPIIGCICMDQMLVDVTEITDVKQNDIAVIIGKCGEDEISACEVAHEAGTITNELLCRLGCRLEVEIL